MKTKVFFAITAALLFSPMFLWLTGYNLVVYQLGLRSPSLFIYQYSLDALADSPEGIKRALHGIGYLEKERRFKAYGRLLNTAHIHTIMESDPRYDVSLEVLRNFYQEPDDSIKELLVRSLSLYKSDKNKNHIEKSMIDYVLNTEKELKDRELVLRAYISEYSTENKESRRLVFLKIIDDETADPALKAAAYRIAGVSHLLSSDEAKIRLKKEKNQGVKNAILESIVILEHVWEGR